jgi:murein DD-endopeptidase MepM/ murein hydrolase activator NlpD
MSDLTVNSSTTFANALNAISGATSSETPSTTESSTSSMMSEFSTMMMIMLLGNMSSQGSTDSGSDSSGFNMNQLMAPLMLSLLEKLTSSQVEDATVADVGATEKSSDVGETDSSSLGKPSGWPAKGPVTQGCHSTHVAIDVGVSIGTKIKSTMGGEVVYAGWNNEGYGNLVIVQNGKYSTYYAHLSKVPVNVGDQVEAGDVVGISGSTGNSTGPHLHYEVRVNGSAVNPTKYMSAT